MLVVTECASTDTGRNVHDEWASPGRGAGVAAEIHCVAATSWHQADTHTNEFQSWSEASNLPTVLPVCRLLVVGAACKAVAFGHRGFDSLHCAQSFGPPQFGSGPDFLGCHLMARSGILNPVIEVRVLASQHYWLVEQLAVSSGFDPEGCRFEPCRASAIPRPPRKGSRGIPRFRKGKAVARMLGHISKMNRFGYSWCNCRHCSPDVQGQRSREKRVTQRWLDEYEDRPEDEAGACPKGGLACTCIKLPDECPYLDWEWWDNDFRRPAIGELLHLEASWTLDSLQVNKTALHWHGSMAL